MLNKLLLLMLISYSIPIIYVYLNYKKNNSISNILSNKNINHKILFFMILMGFFSILYEVERKDKISLLMISILLIGIYGILKINENNKIHYIYAILIFISILGFMINHCKKQKSNILNILLFFQIFILETTIIDFRYNIFYNEVFYVFNFAIYYLYLHFIIQ